MSLSDWSFGKSRKGLPWPHDRDGKPVPPAFLVHLNSTDLEGQIVVSMLESAGIPVMTQYPNNGEFGQVILGFSGTGVDLFVPEHLFEDAKGILEAEYELEEGEDFV